MNLEGLLLRNTVEFSSKDSVVGYESGFIEYLDDKITKLGYDTEITDSGLLVVKSEDENYSNHYTSAHVDRSSLVIQDGKLTYSVHAIKDREEVEIRPTESFCDKIGKRFVDKEVRIGDEVHKVSSYEIVRNENGHNRLEFFLEGDVDVSNYDDQGVSYAKPITISEDKQFLEGQLDNVLSVGALYTLLEEGKVKGNVIFSIGEEVGLSGDKIVDYLHSKGIDKTDELLILDTTPFEEDDYRPEELILRNRDTRGEFNRDGNKLLESILTDNQIPYRFKDKIQEEKGLVQYNESGEVKKGYGKTELGKIVQLTNGDINGITLQLPNTGDGIEERTSIEGFAKFYGVLGEYYNRI